MNPKYLLLLSLLPVVITVYLFDQANAIDQVNTSGGIVGTGHYEVIVKDSLGAVTSYQQSDNDVVNSGENCVAKMIFRHPTNAGTTVCTGATNAAWNYFCLDKSAAITPAKVEIGSIPTDSTLGPCKQASITWNQNSTGTSTALSKVTLRLSTVFTKTDAGSETIVGVGIANDSAISTRSFLSFANFTGVSVPQASTLTVNYDFEVGGGTVP